MPYHDERAGLAAIQALAGAGLVDEFRKELVDRHTGIPLPLPSFTQRPGGTARPYVLAIDGSNIYESIPGALPCTEAGLVSLGVVIIDLGKLRTLAPLPESGAVDPRQLRATERGNTLAAVLPGRNAARSDGTDPRTWFRERINAELESATLGGESFAETLAALVPDRTVKCPDPTCSDKAVELPGPGSSATCQACGTPLWLVDRLRIHEQFEDHGSAAECHARFRDALEILALMNAVRHLAGSEMGRRALGNIAFVMDGPLAAFGTIAVLARGVQKELRRVQEILADEGHTAELLVMSGVKSGPFVDHAEDLDRGPEPDTRIPRSTAWLPNNDYIREHIVAGSSAESAPWGEVTYFGRPVLLKTASGQRLVLNIAQPEIDPPLTDATTPRVLADAIATAEPLGVGAHQFLPLRRVHAKAAIPLRSGTDLIRSLAP